MYSPYNGHQNDILPEDDGSNFLSRFINNLPTIGDEETQNFGKFRENSDSDMIMDSTNFLEKISCEVGAGDCPFNSECIPLGLKMRNGICKCVPGTEENSEGTCVPIRPFSKGPTIPIDAMKKNENSEAKVESGKTESTTQKTVQTLTVSILSKQVGGQTY